MFASQSFGTQPSQLAMGSGGTAKKAEDKNTCLPVTVRSIEVAVARRSGDDEVLFYGSEPGMIVLTGVVESVSQQAASLEISINDSTGRIRIRQYSPEPGSVLATVEPGKYIQVAGNLRTSPEMHVTVASARLVNSPDEISYHMIEAVHAALRLQRGDVEPEKQHPKMDIDMVAGMQPKPLPTAAAKVAPASQASKVVDMQSAVVACLQKEAEGKPEGVPLATVCAKLAPKPESEVRAVLDKLVEDGEAYTTLDDFTYLLI